MPRGQSAVDIVNLMEGEDESAEPDNSAGTHVEVSLDDYIDDAVQVISDSSRSDTADTRKPKRKWNSMHDREITGERAEWSDSDDAEAAYLAFKNRKSIKRKKVAAENKRAKAAATSKNKSRISASRKSDTASRKTTPEWRDYRRVESSEDDQLLDQDLPEYIKSRKERFDQMRDRLGDAGLRLPPTYDDMDFSDDERMAALKEKPVLPNTVPCRPYEDLDLPYSAGIIPAPIAQWLRDYQIEGAWFLHELFVYQRGGILGDDMGLGKTIQVIAFLTAAFGKTGDERDDKRMRKIRRLRKNSWYPRILIVCPSTLMRNWQNELNRWGWWRIYVYHGSTVDKRDALAAAASGHLEIMITTYDTYRISKDAINTIDWDCVVADECHKMKSRTSEITLAMNEINALCRIGLTGTAIQNNYDELWTLLNWSNPGLFGAIFSWKKTISVPLKLGQAHDATFDQLGRARKIAQQLVEKLLPNFFIRRLKTLIADQLPKKRDNIVFCPLTDSQSDAYQRYVASPVVRMIKNATKRCPCNSRKKRGWCCFKFLEDGSKWQSHVFPAIITLQKLANHLALLIPSAEHLPEKQTKDWETLQTALPDQCNDLLRNRDSTLHCANVEFCGKWKILKKLLHFWYTNPSDSGPNKILVFSHSVRLLRMFHDLLTSKTSYNVSYLDGSIPPDDRQQIVDNFNADPDEFVFLISTRAGGVGLNITSANKVVVVDPNWNPSYDLQAQDRAYRIGQRRDVDVFRLISAGTIEEIVYARQVYKQQQANIAYNASLERRYFRGVQDQKEKKGEIFGLQNIFAYRGDNVVLREIVNKTNVAESRAGVLVTDVDMSTQASNDTDQGSQPDRKISKHEPEDAAMSELATLITKDSDILSEMEKEESKTDAIQAILAGAGVSYTHENSEVIGTSKVESGLSRQAIEGVCNIDTIRRHVFLLEHSQIGTPTTKEQNDGSRVCGSKYRPPEDVRRRQFCSMSKHFGFDNVTQFALVVEGWTQAQRRHYLEKFYQARGELVHARGLNRDQTTTEITRKQRTSDSKGEEIQEDSKQAQFASEPKKEELGGDFKEAQPTSDLKREEDIETDNDEL